MKRKLLFLLVILTTSLGISIANSASERQRTKSIMAPGGLVNKFHNYASSKKWEDDDGNPADLLDSTKCPAAPFGYVFALIGDMLKLPVTVPHAVIRCAKKKNN